MLGSNLLRVPPHDSPDFAELLARGRVAEALFGTAPEPVRIGRFELLEVLGCGAMGVVYRGRDPTLEREVAVKVVHSNIASESALTEARALARVGHPHVVAVHDVVGAGDEICIAMELVHGSTLREWLEAEKPDWQMVLDLFLQAGDGLAAVHSASVVHGDFKPDNVLVDDDGRVRVADFGVARLVRHSAATAITGAAAGSTVAGTPVYMAPEQLAGQSADEKSDQFSFCVSLYQALWGNRPFTGATPTELAAAIANGPVVGRSQLKSPRWLRRIVVRGLSAAPADRFSSVREMLRLVRKHRRRRKLGWLVAAAAACALLAGVVGARLARAPGPDCGVGADRFDEIWNEDIRGTLREAFATTGVPYAAETAEKTSHMVNLYRDRWVKANRETCEDTHVRGEQSTALLDKRMACLNRQLRKTDKLVQVLSSEVTPKTLSRAVDAVGALPSPSFCDQQTLLADRIALPSDPRQRQEVAHAYEEIDRSLALMQASKVEEASAVITPLAAKFELANASEEDIASFIPLSAELLSAKGRVQLEQGKFADAEATLRRALQASAHARNDALTAFLWIRIVRALRRLDNADAALQALEMAQLATARANRYHDRLQWEWSLLLVDRGEFLAASDHAEQAVALSRELNGPGHPLTAAALARSANAQRKLGNYDQALALSQEAMKIAVEAWGKNHPRTAIFIEDLATINVALWELDAAIELYQRALSLRESALSKDHPSLATTTFNLHRALLQSGQNDEAEVALLRSLAIRRKHYGEQSTRFAMALKGLAGLAYTRGNYVASIDYSQQAAAIYAEKLGPDHPSLVDCYGTLALAYQREGRSKQALSSYREAIRLVKASYGEEHPKMVTQLNNLGTYYLELKDYSGAKKHFGRAFALGTNVLGPADPEVGDSLTGLANSSLGLSRPDDALPLLRRAVTIREQNLGLPAVIADTHFALARALLAIDPRDLQGIDAAQKALDLYDQAGAVAAHERGDVQKLLDRHRR